MLVGNTWLSVHPSICPFISRCFAGLKNPSYFLSGSPPSISLSGSHYFFSPHSRILCVESLQQNISTRILGENRRIGEKINKFFTFYMKTLDRVTSQESKRSHSSGGRNPLFCKEIAFCLSFLSFIIIIPLDNCSDEK